MALAGSKSDLDDCGCAVGERELKWFAREGKFEFQRGGIERETAEVGALKSVGGIIQGPGKVR